MDWFTFAGINWLAVLVAFVAAFALGWFWYSKAAFFPMWLRLGKISDDDMKNANMGVAFGGVILSNLLGVILLAMLMAGLDVTGAGPGAALGAIVGLVFRGGAHAGHNGFAVRDWRITLIDTAADTAGLALSGLVLGLMG